MDSTIQKILANINKETKEETMKWQDEFEKEFDFVIGQFENHVKKCQTDFSETMNREGQNIENIGTEVANSVNNLETSTETLSRRIGTSIETLEQTIDKLDVDAIKNDVSSANLKLEKIAFQLEEEQKEIGHLSEDSASEKNEICTLQNNISDANSMLKINQSKLDTINSIVNDLVDRYDKSSESNNILKADINSFKVFFANIDTLQQEQVESMAQIKAVENSIVEICNSLKEDESRIQNAVKISIGVGIANSIGILLLIILRAAGIL